MKLAHWQLCLAALCLSVSQYSFALPTLEFDFSAGLATGDVLAPAVNARVGVTPWKYLTFSLRGFAVVGQKGTYISGGHYSGSPGYQGRALFGELRLHTGPIWRVVQPFITFGIGVGKLLNSNCDCEEEPPITGRTSDYEQATLGARIFVSRQFYLSLEMGGNRWNGLSQGKAGYEPPYHVDVVRAIDPVYGGVFLVSFGFQIGTRDGSN